MEELILSAKANARIESQRIYRQQKRDQISYLLCGVLLSSVCGY